LLAKLKSSLQTTLALRQIESEFMDFRRFGIKDQLKTNYIELQKAIIHKNKTALLLLLPNTLLQVQNTKKSN
jgi:hypothetical protein